MRTVRSASVVYRPLASETDLTVPLILAYRKQVDAETLRRFLDLSLAVDPAGFAA